MGNEREKLIEHYYKNKLDAEILIDNVWDPHNVAAVLRSADGFGISKLNLYYTYNEFPNLKKVGKKSSASANKWMNIEKVKDLDDFTKKKKKEGWKFLGADLCKEAQRLDEINFPEKLILVLGSEKKGISPELRKICDDFVFIPMVGMVKSYNISVATGIILYEIFRQKGKNLDLRQ